MSHDVRWCQWDVTKSRHLALCRSERLVLGNLFSFAEQAQRRLFLRLASDPEYLSAIKLRGLRFDPEEIRSARKSAAVMS